MRPVSATLFRTSMYQPSFFFFGKIGGLPIFCLILRLFSLFLICNRKGTIFVPNSLAKCPTGHFKVLAVRVGQTILLPLIFGVPTMTPALEETSSIVQVDTRIPHFPLYGKQRGGQAKNAGQAIV